MTDIEKIKTLITEMNAAWSQGRPENLDAYFHDDIVILSTKMEMLGKGKKACIQSYVDFLNVADNIQFKELEPEIYLFENTAVVHARHEVAWDMEGKSYTEQGHELYVFEKLNKHWLLVVRKLMPSES